jgi:hypothetical protein
MNRQVMISKLKVRLKKAYRAYIDTFYCPSFRENLKFHIRMLECMLEENGFRGISTGLISIEAFETKLKKARGESISNMDNTSLEHPVPYRILATHCLKRDTPLSEEVFIALWLNNLITAIVTKKQNWMLIKFQSDFKIGDDWKEMYAKAGIILMVDPSFNNNDVRKQYGLEPIKRGRKKNAK